MGKIIQILNFGKRKSGFDFLSVESAKLLPGFGSSSSLSSLTLVPLLFSTMINLYGWKNFCVSWYFFMTCYKIFMNNLKLNRNLSYKVINFIFDYSLCGVRLFVGFHIWDGNQSICVGTSNIFQFFFQQVIIEYSTIAKNA